MWLGIGSVADVYPTMKHRSEVEREKGSRIAEPIFPTSAANLPVVAAGKGPQSGPSREVTEPQQRMPFFCHA